MHFPLWRYLKQPLWDKTRPATLNPFAYWYHYKILYLKRCHANAFLEECWDVNYQDFVTQHHHLCDRTALEENPVWLLERCWRLMKHSLYSAHSNDGYVENPRSEDCSSETEHF